MVTIKRRRGSYATEGKIPIQITAKVRGGNIKEGYLKKNGVGEVEGVGLIIEVRSD
jgi:hypothetical protein